MLAAVVRLLDRSRSASATRNMPRDNKSFGATTLRSRHRPRQRPQADDALHRQARHRPRSDHHRHASSSASCASCQELPGQMLFQYVNGDGEPQPVTSGDVNDYIREATGGEFTAKHFRTWGASVIAFEQLLTKAEDSADQRQDDGRAGRRSARQHRRDEPQVLCPSGADRGGQGAIRATRWTAWTGRARANGCRRRGRPARASSPGGKRRASRTGKKAA